MFIWTRMASVPAHLGRDLIRRNSTPASSLSSSLAVIGPARCILVVERLVSPQCNGIGITFQDTPGSLCH